MSNIFHLECLDLVVATSEHICNSNLVFVESFETEVQVVPLSLQLIMIRHINCQRRCLTRDVIRTEVVDALPHEGTQHSVLIPISILILLSTRQSEDVVHVILLHQTAWVRHQPSAPYAHTVLSSSLHLFVELVTQRLLSRRFNYFVILILALALLFSLEQYLHLPNAALVYWHPVYYVAFLHVEVTTLAQS